MAQLPNEHRSLKLALLVNDTPVQPVIDEFGEYPKIYNRWLEDSRPDQSISFQMDAYDVVNKPGSYPKAEEYDAIVLTGSAASAYSPLPWIEQLKSYIASVAKSHPQTRLIGICFGHQIIASALGGECVPNDGTWEIGVTDVLLSPDGKAVFGADSISIQQFHRDHVPKVPPGFTLLGSTTISAVQGLLLRYPNAPKDSPPTPQDTHILTVQGHPEFTGPIVEKIVNVRAERGILNEARAAQAREDGYKPHDGNNRIGKAIWDVILAPRI